MPDTFRIVYTIDLNFVMPLDNSEVKKVERALKEGRFDIQTKNLRTMIVDIEEPVLMLKSLEAGCLPNEYIFRLLEGVVGSQWRKRIREISRIASPSW